MTPTTYGACVPTRRSSRSGSGCRCTSPPAECGTCDGGHRVQVALGGRRHRARVGLSVTARDAGRIARAILCRVGDAREPHRGVAVTVRAGGEPCRWELGCLAGVTLTPVGSDAPALEGTIDPSADPASPEASLQATLAPGTYVASVTALGVTEAGARG